MSLIRPEPLIRSTSPGTNFRVVEFGEFGGLMLLKLWFNADKIVSLIHFETNHGGFMQRLHHLFAVRLVNDD